MAFQPFYATEYKSDTTKPPGPLTAIRASRIVALVIQNEGYYDGVDFSQDESGNPVVTAINPVVKYAVYGIVANGLSARVASFNSLSDANNYLSTDPDGLISN